MSPELTADEVLVERALAQELPRDDFAYTGGLAARQVDDNVIDADDWLRNASLAAPPPVPPRRPTPSSGSPDIPSSRCPPSPPPAGSRS